MTSVVSPRPWPLVAFCAVHCVITAAALWFTLGWTMIVLDGGGNEAPFALTVLGLVTQILGFPVIFPGALGLPLLGFHDPVNDPIYWAAPLLNSTVWTLTLYGVMRWRQKRSARL